jgi:hypothetical protein
LGIRTVRRYSIYTSGGEHILDHMDHVDVKNIGLV